MRVDVGVAGPLSSAALCHVKLDGWEWRRVAKKVTMKSISVQRESEYDQNSLIRSGQRPGCRRSGLKLNWGHDEDVQHLEEQNAA